jgi:glycosyltransferase involved in cell wall biosynthesis
MTAAAVQDSVDQPTVSEYSIIYFGNDWSAENRTSSHHVATRLSRCNPLLYVEVPGLRAPKATARDVRKLFRKLKLAFKSPRKVGEQMWCMTMPQFPFRRIGFIRWLNRVLGGYLVQRAVGELGFSGVISWFVVPHAGSLAGRLGEVLIVYYCIDDYAALPDVDRREVARMDAALVRRADQVFVASSTLLASKRNINSFVAHAPHGVDVQMFRQATDPDLPLPDAVRNVKRPVIGFFGLIEAWIDLDLITFLAKARPTWTFLIVGRTAVDVGQLKQLNNVILTGPQAYETLPRWAKAFDVAIIPYRLTEQVMHANPLKLREYLATGKPVVSVRTPEVEQFAQHVRIASDPDGFLRGIEQALDLDSEEDRSLRLKAVERMSWESRVTDVLAIVERRLMDRSRTIGLKTRTTGQ